MRMTFVVAVIFIVWTALTMLFILGVIKLFEIY